MQRLQVSGAVRPIYGSLGVKRLTTFGTVLEVAVRSCNWAGPDVESHMSCRAPAVLSNDLENLVSKRHGRSTTWARHM